MHIEFDHDAIERLLTEAVTRRGFRVMGVSINATFDEEDETVDATARIEVTGDSFDETQKGADIHASERSAAAIT